MTRPGSPPRSPLRPTPAGLITHLQRFSLHDGPGIRTTVFLKGCNMRCPWCHNPEAIGFGVQLQFSSPRCIGCGACVRACQQGAQRLEEARRSIDRDSCQVRGDCARACHPQALLLVGRTVEVGEVLEEVEEDRPFYRDSGGGVTLSGGEPLCQPEFCRALLQGCKASGYHTAVETNGAWPRRSGEAILPYTDLFMVDLKLFSPAAHRRWTGMSNQRVLSNLRWLAERKANLWVRTPIIPGVNDTEEEVGAIAAFVASLPGNPRYELLPYHPLGTGKYPALGMEERMPEVAPLDPEAMGWLRRVAKGRGAAVATG